MKICAIFLSRPIFLDFQEFHRGLWVHPALPRPQAPWLTLQPTYPSFIHTQAQTASLWPGGTPPSSVTCLQKGGHEEGLMQAVQGCLAGTPGGRCLGKSLAGGLYSVPVALPSVRCRQWGGACNQKRAELGPLAQGSGQSCL